MSSSTHRTSKQTKTAIPTATQSTCAGSSWRHGIVIEPVRSDTIDATAMNTSNKAMVNLPPIHSSWPAHRAATESDALGVVVGADQVEERF